MCAAVPTELFERGEIVTDPAELVTYEADAGFDRGRPDAVVYPRTAADVQKLAAWAHARGVPLVARGAGTGLSGGAVAERGGIVVEFARLNRILELDADGRSARVEPGVVNLTLDAAAKERGLYYPPDPSSGRSAQLGGNLAENAGGPHCFKYGVTTNYVIGLDIVLADGRAMRLGGRALDMPEVDLCGVVVGSEGTLALITGADVRLIRNPPAVKTMMAAFDSDEAAGQAVSAVIAAGLTPATLEMMDRQVMGMIEAYAAVGLPVHAQAALIVEVDGYPESLDSQVEEILDILRGHGGFDLRIAQSEAERQRIWYGRKSAAGAFARLSPSYYMIDVTVPRSRLADTLAGVNAICRQYGIRVGHVFHAGDGNLHPALLCDVRDGEVMERVFAACREIVALCVAEDGSITGEHGVGLEKRAYMPMMYSGAELAAMCEVKELFDPSYTLNPGKIFPDRLPAPAAVRVGALPEETFAPRDAGEAAAGLAAASRAGRPVWIGGARPGESRGIRLTTERLAGIRRLAPADLYVTVGAGTTLAALEGELAEQGLQTALAAPWPGATVGGVVSAGLNGPHRLRYGAVRDNVLALSVALADGRALRLGRPVVKNVAGYDLAKLFVGAWGTLGLIEEVTLKAMRQPRVRRTLCAPVEQLEQGLRWADVVLGQALVASAVALAPRERGTGGAPYRLVCTFEGLAEDVEVELAAAAAALRKAGAEPTEEAGASGTERWSAFLARRGAEATVRVGVPRQEGARYWAGLPAAQTAGEWFMDAAAGHFYAAAAPGGAVEQWLAALRGPAQALGGYAVPVNGAGWPVGGAQCWGAPPSGLPLMQALKRRWDPVGILNPGVFIVE